jgi:hypothetical protein
VQHIAGLVRPGGVFITAALRRCRRYLVGGKAFPSADVDENDLRAVLEPRFVCEGGSIEAWDLAEHESQGSTGIVLGWARGSVQAAVGGDSSGRTAIRARTMRGVPPLWNSACGRRQANAICLDDRPLTIYRDHAV